MLSTLQRGGQSHENLQVAKHSLEACQCSITRKIELNLLLARFSLAIKEIVFEQVCSFSRVNWVVFTATGVGPISLWCLSDWQGDSERYFTLHSGQMLWKSHSVE